MFRAGVLFGGFLLLAAPAQAADEDKDLDLIPESVQQPTTSATEPVPVVRGAGYSLYLENALTLSSLRSGLVVPVGQSTVLYAEWAGGERASLIAEALRHGQQTGTFPANTPSALPVDRRTHFQNDLSAGFSYTAPIKLTLNAEYHFHQAGFSHRDWQNWFAIGQARAAFAPIPAQLWFIRGYAQDQQEPVPEHSFFLRADWTDAFIRDLELAALADVNLYDGSSLIQGTASYYLSPQWTLGALAGADLGRRHSEFGSLQRAATVLVKAARYF